MPATLRLRVGGLTLLTRAAKPTRLLEAPATHRAFLVGSGGDIVLDLSEERPPEPDGERLFVSGGVWSVHRHRRGLLYAFETPRLEPPLYKAVVIDAKLARGTLFFPKPVSGPRPRFALDYPLDELLFQHRLVRDGAIEVHACGVVVNGRLVLFAGVSGAGKSTTARLWQHFQPRMPILSDDRIVLRRAGRGFRGFGTPWHGDGGFARNRSAPLGAIVFLSHAPRTRLVALGPAAAAARLLARSFPPPWDGSLLARALDTCARAATRVPAYALEFTPDQSAVDAVREAVA